jgi:hypothetical protein
MYFLKRISKADCKFRVLTDVNKETNMHQLSNLPAPQITIQAESITSVLNKVLLTVSEFSGLGSSWTPEDLEEPRKVHITSLSLLDQSNGFNMLTELHNTLEGFSVVWN